MRKLKEEKKYSMMPYCCTLTLFCVPRQKRSSQNESRDGMIGLQECGPAPPRAPPSATTRERTAIAVDYYNTHVQRAWANAGLSTNRSSFNDRHRNHSTPRRPQYLQPDYLCRSNSSLELLEHNSQLSNCSSPLLKREYGSHGSIDVIDKTLGIPFHNEFFKMLQDYKPAGLVGVDQRSPDLGIPARQVGRQSRRATCRKAPSTGTS
ncbi:hypothetical protein JTB14_002500 [Gonioctena quinquepunctata]|nr:hypothetical protein JTB14_002500 [Gonioctena quinquepunctata]